MPSKRLTEETKIKLVDGYKTIYTCEACGSSYIYIFDGDVSNRNFEPKFCPECGRRNGSFDQNTIQRAESKTSGNGGDVISRQPKATHQ